MNELCDLSHWCFVSGAKNHFSKLKLRAKIHVVETSFLVHYFKVSNDTSLPLLRPFTRLRVKLRLHEFSINPEQVFLMVEHELQ